MPNTRELELWRLVNNAFQNSIEKFGDIFAKDVTRDLLANGVTVQKWIPVTERLPEMWQNVLTVRTDGKFRFDFVGSLGVWYEDVNFVGYPVTHWMPLPEPPKGE